MIIVIGNQKGGVGKSTLAVNLAVAYQQQDHSVQLVEADPSVRTVSNWADDRERQECEPILTVRKDGRLNSTLKAMSEHYDVVIVDTAGKDSQELRSALITADIAIIPTQPTQTDLDTTSDFMELIEDVKSINHGLKNIIVLTRVSTHPESKDISEATDYLNSTASLQNGTVCLAETIIYQRKTYQTVLSTGQAVIETKNGKAAQEIQNLAQEIQGLAENPDPEEQSRTQPSPKNEQNPADNQKLTIQTLQT